MTTTTTLTEADFERLLAGDTIRANRASLWVGHALCDPRGWPTRDEPRELRIMMEGPSGKHSLLAIATDLDRLNAHWTIFCQDVRNLRAS